MKVLICRLIILFFIIYVGSKLTPLQVYAADHVYSWTKTFGGTGADLGNTITIDVANAIIYTGSFSGSGVDLDPTETQDLKTSNGGTDAFITKLNYDGSYGWTKSFGGTGTEEITSILSNSVGELFISGKFNSSVDFNPEAGVDIKTPIGGYDAFLVKINSDGTYGWSKTWGGSGSDDATNEIQLSPDGNILLTGYFNSASVDFDPGPGSDIKNRVGGYDIFILKLEADGDYVWSKTIGGTGSEYGNDIAVASNGDFYVASDFGSASIDFNPSDAVDTRGAVGSSDSALTKFFADGSYGWTKAVGGSGTDEGNAVAVSNSGHVYVGGFFSSTVDFDPSLNVNSITSKGGLDTYISKFSTDGDYIWTKTVGGSSDERNSYGSLKLDSNGNIYFAGRFNSSNADFDPGVTTDTFATKGGHDAFVIKLLSDGSYGWTKTIGGSGTDWTLGIALNNLNDLYSLGYFNVTVDFDPGSGTDQKTSIGNSDIFLSKYTYDQTAPSLSNLLPISNSTLTSSDLTITFQSDERSSCRLSLSDETYTDMSNDVSCSGSGTTVHSCLSSDLGSDGVKTLFIACADTYGNEHTVSSNTQLTYTLNSQAPTITLDSVGSPTNNSFPPISGRAADTQGTIQTVEYQVGSTTGIWTRCIATDGIFDNNSETFTCTVSVSLSEGSHTVYIRATDNDGNMTTSGAEVSVGVVVDTTSPKKDFTQVTEEGLRVDKVFKPTSLNNLNVVGDTHFPQFCFTRGYDNGSGLSSYSVVVDRQDYLTNIPYVQPPVGDNGDTIQDGDSIIKENTNWYLQYHLYDNVTQQQEICTYGKTDVHYLDTGVHSWSVTAIDQAGNRTSTDINRFLVMTNQGTDLTTDDSTWFPLTLLQVGNRANLTAYSSNIPALYTQASTPLSFQDATPSFYGIAPVGATITLTLTQDTLNQADIAHNEQVINLTTTANSSSEWGLNLETPLNPGSYFLTIKAADLEDHFAILKDIPIKLSTLLPVADAITTNDNGYSDSVLGDTDQVTDSDDTDSTPETTKSSGKPSPSPKSVSKRFCIPFTSWCW